MKERKFIKVLVNGGFGNLYVSERVVRQFRNQYNAEVNLEERADPRLVELVEKDLEEQAAYGVIGDTRIIRIPVGCNWWIIKRENEEFVLWELPKNQIIMDLHEMWAGRLQVQDAHPLTVEFMQSGMTFDEFEEEFRKVHINGT